MSKIDWLRAIKAGEVMAVENSRIGQTLKAEHVMWELLKEAAEVSHVAYGGPPKSGFPAKSSMPDAQDEISMWTRIMEYLRGMADELPVTESRRPQPSAEQISRCEAILHLWHHHALARKGARAKIKKAVYLMACGWPARKVVFFTGVSRHAIYRARDEAMRDMLNKIQ